MEIITIFFSKSTGLIKTFSQGRYDMSYFGEFAEDYTHILDFIVLESGIPVKFGETYKDYKVDLTTKQLVSIVKNPYIEQLEQENAKLREDLTIFQTAFDEFLMGGM